MSRGQICFATKKNHSFEFRVSSECDSSFFVGFRMPSKGPRHYARGSSFKLKLET